MRMSRVDHISALARDDHGAVLVMFAVFAPVAILLAAFAIDTGNWWLQKRHLQLQADAGALAAAQQFQPCEDDLIYKKAGRYSGAKSLTIPGGGNVTSVSSKTELFNLLTGTTEQSPTMHELINSQTYYGQSTPVDSSASTMAPCAGQMVDVKLTETDLPWYFRPFASLLSIHPYINAHARVEIRQETQVSGPHLLPVALADSKPRSAAVCFVNEETGALLKSTQLPEKPTGSNVWESVPTRVAIAPHVAVRIALSGSASTSCTGTDPNRIVYDTSNEKLGILHIQGWTGNGTGGEGGSSHPAPIVREVRLLPAGCTDAYFSNSTVAPSCAIEVLAVIDGITNATPGAKVTAEVELNEKKEKYPLSYSGGKWTAGAINLGARAGSIPITLTVTDTAMQAVKKGEKSITVTPHRSYTANANSGPIQSAVVLERGAGGANSFRRCEPNYEGLQCEPELAVRIETAGLENVASVKGLPIEFPVKEGIRNCPPGNNFKQRVAQGCEGIWAINKGAPCTTKPPVVTCVELESSGVKANDFAAGLNQRILENEKAKACTAPNHWSLYPNLPQNDPRIVTIVVIPFGSTAAAKPIESFGTFYITGWAGVGAGKENPCQGKGDDPAPSSTMVGHFIKYVNTTDPGGGGTTICEPNAFGQCVAVLTR
jgi:Putative Flp pilus-assembly TadE/G-like